MDIEADQVLAVLRGRERPAMPLKAILRRLGAARGEGARSARRQLRGLLREMVDARKLERTPEGYRAARSDGLIEGLVSEARSRDGSVWDGRAHGDDGEEWEVRSEFAIEPGSRVLLSPASESLGRAEVVRRVGGERDHWVGIFSARGGGSVFPYRDSERWRIRVAGGDRGGARDGEVVVVVPKSSRTSGKESSADPRGRIIERLGRPGDAEADFRAVSWRHRLPLKFEDAVLAEADALEESLDPLEVARRVDLRDHCFLTIDPGDAKDHDDALCIERLDGDDDAIRLWVAIADVAHYVAEESALDREALQRGNSVYFPGRVIPMLPERISGDLCSLRPDRDRFAMVVEMIVSAEGRIARRSFYPAVIRSRARLSYSEAAAVMEPERETDSAARVELSGDVEDQLLGIAACARSLSRRRFEEGSIDFDVRESRVILDAEGRPEAIVEAERTFAHRAVEESMLAANREVAKLLGRAGLSCLYRIHESPDPGRLEALTELLDSFDLLGKAAGRKTLDPALDPAPGEKLDQRLEKRADKVRAGKGGSRVVARGQRDLSPQELNAALRRVAGHAEDSLVNMVALRSMRKARYAPEDLGHFALGFESYLHFTSPIRRYADLVVHRCLKEWLSGGDPSRSASEKRELQSSESLRGVAARVSDRERLAVEAEREIVDLKKCAYMARHVGEEFDGTISGVSIHGAFVTLDAVHVDGLVHISGLGEDLVFDERLHMLSGRRSGQRFRLGDAIRVHIDDVDPIRARIRMSLITGQGSPGEGAQRRNARREKLSRGRPSKPKARRKASPTRRRGR